MSVYFVSVAGIIAVCNATDSLMFHLLNIDHNDQIGSLRSETCVSCNERQIHDNSLDFIYLCNFLFSVAVFSFVWLCQ